MNRRKIIDLLIILFLSSAIISLISALCIHDWFYEFYESGGLEKTTRYGLMDKESTTKHEDGKFFITEPSVQEDGKYIILLDGKLGTYWLMLELQDN